MKSTKNTGARFNPWQNILSRVDKMGVIDPVGEGSMAVMFVLHYLNTV